jgi:hypothetical protein
MGTAAAIVGGSIIGGVFQGKAAKSASKASSKASGAAIAEQRAAREQALATAQPFVDIGLGAGEQLQALLADPSQGLEEINPIVDFLRNEGFDQIQESAAAGGRLGAGGTLKDLTRFNSDLTSTVVPQLQNQRFNQLFNVLGIGQNAAAGQGSAALQTGANVSNLLSQQGQAQAQGAINQSNAITGTLQNLAGGVGAFGMPNFGGGGGGGGGVTSTPAAASAFGGIPAGGSPLQNFQASMQPHF